MVQQLLYVSTGGAIQHSQKSSKLGNAASCFTLGKARVEECLLMNKVGKRSVHVLIDWQSVTLLNVKSTRSANHFFGLCKPFILEYRKRQNTNDQSDAPSRSWTLENSREAMNAFQQTRYINGNVRHFNLGSTPMKKLFGLLIATVAFAALLLSPTFSYAEHAGKIQILLLGDSTTEGSVPRRIRPEGPHLEKVLEQLLAAESDLPACHVINSSVSGETIRRLIDSGRYDRDAAKLPGVDYIFIRYGLNDRARRDNFAVNFPKDFHELLATLRKDHPNALLIPMTVIPFANEEVSKEINDLVRAVAKEEKLAVFDIYPRYAAELKKGHNMLNYRRYPLAKIPEQYHALVQPFVNGPSVEVMANELDAVLGHLPNWYSDRHPNLAGYNVIADETAKYQAKLLREKK